MEGKWCRILKTTKTLTFTLNEIGSRWRGTWSDFHFHEIVLATGGRLDRKQGVDVEARGEAGVQVRSCCNNSDKRCGSLDQGGDREGEEKQYDSTILLWKMSNLNKLEQ